MSSTLQKTYMYHVYRGGTFLGVLQDVVSPFKTAQEINSAFVQLEIEVAITADRSNEAVEAIQTEAGEDITAEDGAPLLIERQPDVVGNSNNLIKIRNNNRIKVYEYSTYYPSGTLVFSGKIESWEANFGQPDGRVVAQCVSEGADMEDQIIQTGVTYTTQIEQLLYTDNGFGAPQTYAWGHDYAYTPPGARLAQVFAPASGFSIGKIAVYNSPLQVGHTITCKLYQGNIPGSGTLLATSSIVANTAGFSWTEFVFPTPVTLSAATSYYFELSGEAGLWSTQYLGVRLTGDVYGGGNLWQASTASPYSEIVGTDGMFKIYSADATTVSPYTSDDPTDILKSIIDDYVARGGTVDYSASSTDNTSLSVSYTFKLNTTLEGVKKCLELAPYDWYWYVDQGTSIIHFEQTATTGTHKIVKGRHISSLKLKSSMEKTINKIYFSGGDTGGGVNLFKEYSDTDSIAEFGQQLERISDNRVTLAATATAIANSRLDERADEEYQTQVEIIDGTFDTLLFKPGDTVVFEGFGSFVDGLIMQIVRIQREPDKATLSLGKMPNRLTLSVEQMLKDLIALQTVDNPSAPS